MKSRPLRMGLWALATLLLGPLAPSLADGNIGCLFSSTICTKGVEWCYDDDAFGKCISVYQEEPNDVGLYKHLMTPEELKTFEMELQNLVERGYRWEHAYTQCVLQSMLFASRQKKKNVNLKVCEPLKDPDIITSSEDDDFEVPADDVAIIHYSPEVPPNNGGEFASVVYAPPNDGSNTPYAENAYEPKLKSVDSGDVVYEPGLILNHKTKKNIDIFDKLVENMKQSQPYTAEYLTNNRFSAKENKILSNTINKYKENFRNKHFPFEYEDERNEFPPPEERQTYDELTDELENQGDLEHVETVNFEGNVWNHNIQMPDHTKGKDFKGLLRNYEHFRRLERLDVKKPGPPWDDKIKNLFLIKTENNVTDSQTVSPAENKKGGKFTIDRSYAYVTFENGGTEWVDGVRVIKKIQELLHLEKGAFSHPRYNVSEVSFKVEPNIRGYSAEEVARRIETLQGALYNHLGIVVTSVGIGDQKKEEVSKVPVSFFPSSIPTMVLAPVAVASAFLLLLAIFLGFYVYSKRVPTDKFKSSGLVTAAQIDAEASNDYQDLCRARMSRGGAGGADTAQSVRGGVREHDASPSARSSTSSWSEEPALTNMDISTGHMVLAYMEDHLKNKDRLDQEWKALCAYEAEPCATTAANKEENLKKNRSPDILPYDHSRVVLNTITNENGSDYINASSITDHDPRNPAYIAAQGPMEHTAADFWQLIWEQGSVVTVLLTRLQENGTSLCYRYWPEEGSHTYHIYEVHLVSEHIWCDDYLVRSFYLKNQKTGETRTVTQFHFLSWPDNGVPASTKALLEFRRKVNKSYRGRSCPIVVHCSDGAGRSGTYCLIDMVLNRMAKGAKEIDIAATLEHIRDQRPNMVSTKQQFEFVLMAVAEEVHAILKALPAQLQQQQEKKDMAEKDK